MNENIPIVSRVYEAFNRKNYSTVLEFFDDNVQWIAADHSPLADRSPYKGLSAVRDGVFQRIAESFEFLTVHPDELVDAGDKVVGLGYYHGKLKGKDQSFKAQVAHVWTLREGRVIKLQQYTDTYQIAMAVKG